MRVGVDGNHTHGFKTRGIMKTLEFAKEQGLDGVLVKTVVDLSPSLDDGELREIKAYASELGLYLECGIGRVNPYNTAESSEIRALGGGDYRWAVERMIRAARAIDCTELWADTATSADKQKYSSRFRIDRFRTDVSWNDQLEATEKFLKSLAPLLRDLGSRIDVETHEDITSFEVVRLVEAVGPDVVGITYDTGNGLLRGEVPVEAAARVAPYTHLTHIKDAILFFDNDGLVRQIHSCGQGVIDWETILETLGRYSPDLHLSLEDHKVLEKIPIYDRSWLEKQPDLTVAELAELVHLAAICQERISCGEIPDPSIYEQIPFENQWIERIQQSSKYLRAILGKIEPNSSML